MRQGERAPPYDFWHFARAALGVVPADDAQPPSGVFLRHVTLDSVPRVLLAPRDLMALALDHRTGFVLSRIDGTHTVDAILDTCAMAREEALGILRHLAAMGVVAFD